jgi:hypothetical protein
MGWGHAIGSQHSDDADEDPKDVQNRVGVVLFQNRTPREQHGIDGIERPHKYEGAARPHPTDEAETEDTHQDADHFNSPDVSFDQAIDGKKVFIHGPILPIGG